MYIIKINDETKKDKCWIGHSNASDSSGFYLTRETTAKIFVDEVNDIPKLKDWLEKKDYSYSVVQIKDKKNRRVY